MVANCYVYVIFRLDGSPCYVGKGRGNRLHNHDTRSTNPHLTNIVAKVKKLGKELPKVKIRQNLTDEQAFAIEVALIAAIGRKANGGPLVNMTDGGDGLLNPSAETRAKMSAKAKARSLTPEGRARILAMVKLSASGPKSLETRAKMSASYKLLKKTPEHQAAINRAITGKLKSASHIEAMRKSRTGKPTKPATQSRKEKVRAASLAFWARWREGGIDRKMRGKNRNLNLEKEGKLS